MADSNSEDDVVPRAGRRQRAAPVDAPVEDEPVDAPAEPVRRRRPAAAPVEAPAEAEEEAEAPSGPRRSARKPAKSAATKRRNLRESRRILAESGLNAENNREGVEEQAEEAEQAAEAEQAEEAGEEGEGEQQAEAGEMGPLGMIGAMLKSTVNYLKTDPYEQAFGNNRDEEPYPSLKELYETAKENPDSAETLRQVTSDFRALKQRYHDEGCDTDINVSMNPRCIGVQAGLYMRLFDIRKSIDNSLEQMRPIQQPAVLARINREARPEYNGEDNVFVPAGV
jgi:hypothetical protein